MTLREPPVLDVLTIGRSSIDVYPLQTNLPLEDLDSFGKFLGGSPTNVAVAASRLGRRSKVITAVGDDPFGRFIARELERFGVDASGVAVLDDVATSLAFCELFPPDDFPLYFYRADPPPELRLGAEHISAERAAEARLLWLTVTGLSLEPSRAAHHDAMAIRGAHGRRIVLDLDYRPAFWQSEEIARQRVQEALAKVSVAVGNREECRIAVGETEPERAADALLAAGVDLAIVKQGPRGVLAKTADERVVVAATPCEVVNGLGAGDGFGGALCHGLLAGWDLARCIAFASAAGAIVASRLECSGAMPAESEVDHVLARGHVPAEMP